MMSKFWDWLDKWIPPSVGQLIHEDGQRCIARMEWQHRELRLIEMKMSPPQQMNDDVLYGRRYMTEGDLQ